MKSILFFFFLIYSTQSFAQHTLRVGSKTFAESYILGELIAQVAEKVNESKVERRLGLGGTGILFQALKSDSIDIYPEYTGTISEAILKKPSLKTISQLSDQLRSMGLIISNPLGFNNTYAIATTQEISKKHNLKKISDLKGRISLPVGVSHEFLDRSDGFKKLMKFYELEFENLNGLQHSLAYEALIQNQISLTDIYSTDAKIEKYNLVLLEDDKNFFPAYYAVFLARKDFPIRFPKTWRELKKIEGRISNEVMTNLNALVEIDKKSFAHSASVFQKDFLKTKVKSKSLISNLLGNGIDHLRLVGLSVGLAILIGLPLGILAARNKALGQMILVLSGLLQTIPSLALLCFLIPLFGIGETPALVALFLYSLLPIVVNTHSGLLSIDPKLIESARSIGLTTIKRLRIIDLPLSSRNILDGIKTSAIISIGTATLAALIGAGGYGVPIVTGLALNDLNLILTGAIPAGMMAIITQGLFVILEKTLIPKGIRS